LPAAIGEAVIGGIALSAALKSKSTPQVTTPNPAAATKPCAPYLALQSLGEHITDNAPIILPTGKDYHAGDKINEQVLQIEARQTAALASTVPVIGPAVKVGNLAIRAAEAFSELGNNLPLPSGLAFATPNGTTLTGALEAAPAAVGTVEGIGKTIAAVSGARPQDDVALAFSRKTDGKDQPPQASSAGRVEAPPRNGLVDLIQMLLTTSKN
jgi:hypothetical protein